MSSEENVNIPLKRVKIGTFETDKTEVLKIVDLHLKFSLQVEGKNIFVSIKKDNVAKVALVFSPEKNFVGLILHPQLAKDIEEILPKHHKYCFHSKIPRESRFVIEFASNLGELTKGILSSFFFDIPTTEMIDDDNMEEAEATETPMVTNDDDKKSLKKKGSDCENGENIPPLKKKLRVDENGQQPTRNLRSRNRSQVKDYNPGDYATDEEEIPEAARVESETTVSKPPSRFDRFEHFENTIHLLTYRDIIIQMEDYKCLDRRELVSNFVLDFYLQYLYHEVFPEELRSRVHIYKTHFYTMLSTKANFAGWKDNEIKGLKAADKRYERVKDIDSDVNIFDRDFLVFPCNTNEHYFLAIACYPRLNGAVYAETGEPIVDEEERNRDIRNPTDGKALKASVMLIFDSVSTNAGRKVAATSHIKNFLMSKYQEKYSAEFPFELTNVRSCMPKCPQQTNATDCGLFVLEFFEQFFRKSPITDFRLPINLSTWFDPSIILEKRETIANIIKHKIIEQTSDGQELPNLPDISFSVESDEMSIQKDENEVTNGNQPANGNVDENNGNGQENNGNVDENGNGDNNNEEAFNNNNDFNAVDHNIQQPPADNEVRVSPPPVPEESGEPTVSSTTDFVDPSPPATPESPDLIENGNGEVTVISDSD